VKRHAAYIPISALTDDEKQRYFDEVARKSKLYPYVFKGEAARAGIRARLVRERTP
jgi:hypothetical protein